MAVVCEMKIDNTKIFIDDQYCAKTEEEHERVMKNFFEACQNALNNTKYNQDEIDEILKKHKEEKQAKQNKKEVIQNV